MRRFSFTLAVVAALATMPPASERIFSQTENVIDDREAYAVYASILPARFTSGDTNLTAVALSQQTRAEAQCLPKAEEWRVVVESYQRENARPRLLLPGFDLGVAYTLVSAAERPVPSRDYYAQFPNGKLLSFSAVGFDQTRTRALVTVQYGCGFNCAGGWTVLREKNGDRWTEPNGNVETCTWIA